MKAKFIQAYRYSEWNRSIVELEYEYRGHRYTVMEDKSKGNEPLAWQHRAEQDRIDRIIEMEERDSNTEAKESSNSVDEALRQFFEEWEM